MNCLFMLFTDSFYFVVFILNIKEGIHMLDIVCILYMLQVILRLPFEF